MKRRKKLLIEGLESYDTVVEMLQMNDFDMTLIDDDYYISSGIEADIYEVRGHPDKVLRIISNVDPSELNIKDARNYVREMNKVKKERFDHVVTVYYNTYAKDYNVVVSLLEKLEPVELSPKELNYFMFRTFNDFIEKYIREDSYYSNYFVNNKKQFLELYRAFAKMTNEDAYAYGDMEFTENVQELAYHILKGVDELLSIDIVPPDIHIGNVMKDPKTGNYKLIDFVFF